MADHEEKLNAAVKAISGEPWAKNVGVENIVSSAKANAALNVQSMKKETSQALKGAAFTYGQKSALLGEDHEDTKAAADYMALKHGELKQYPDYNRPTTDSMIAESMNNGQKAAESYQKLQALLGDNLKAKADFENRDFKTGVTPEFSKHQKAQLSDIPASEKNTLASYTGSEFSSINRAVGRYSAALEAGTPTKPISPDTKKSIERMDSAFEGKSLGQDMNLRRNMAAGYFFQGLGSDHLSAKNFDQKTLDSFVGKVYRETAFSSTSTNMNFSSSYSGAVSETGKVSLNIRAPKEANGLWLKPISNHSGEDEVALPRGSTYIVRSVTRKGEGYNVSVDLIGNFPATL